MKKLFALIALALVAAACLPPLPDVVKLGDTQLTVVADDSVWNATDYEGKPVLIVFMGSWCPYCKMSMPAVNAVAQKFEGKAEVVGAFVDDDAAPVKQAVKDNGFTAKALYGAGELSEGLEVTGLPHAVLFDKKHRLVKTWANGFQPNFEEEFTFYLEKQLN